jgi:hypothetical protein
MANIFPKWTNKIPLRLTLISGILTVSILVGVTYYFTPKYTRVGYAPTQPVPYDHSLHVGQLGMDCRYCHTFVDQSGHANVPDAGTCMNCHNAIKADSPLLAPIRESFASGKPVNWVRIHQTPDYVYFNHSVHVNRGISCVDCHGQINEMVTVEHAKPLSMSFCLDCHRTPEAFVRDLDKVYDLTWKPTSPEAQLSHGKELVEHWKINPPESCSGCHR